MQIERIPYIAPKSVPSTLKNQSVDGGKSIGLPAKKSEQNAASGNNLPTVDISGKPDLKEQAREMLIEHQKMGEFKNKKGLDETTDLTMGGDIRFALKSRNVDFLKRLAWGGLTVSEYREVKYRIRELENRNVQNPNVLDGKVIDAGRKFRVNDTEAFVLPQFAAKA